MEELPAQMEGGLNANSFTEISKRMFNEPAKISFFNKKGLDVSEESLDSIYEKANACHKSLIDFIQDDPEYAVLYAETSYSKWTNVLTQAALAGSINTSDGAVTISRNQIKALELRMAQAKRELDMVTDYAISFMGGDGKKRDHLIRILYMNAVMRRDTKAITYLIDRIDGRPGETRVAQLTYDNAYNIYMILHSLFDKQLNVLNVGNGTILICCSRRAGKTMMLVAGAIIECMRTPNTTCIYIGETMELTEDLIDDAMNKLNQRCHLQDKKGNAFNWRKMDNGSKLLVRGLSNTKDPDQIRGRGAKIIVIDEFFHLKSDLLEYIQREVLKPMQMDYAGDYKFICAGTPPPNKGTYGEMAWKTWEVPHFKWTWKDNPYPSSLEDRTAYVEKEIQDMGLSWETPFVRREYLGEWAYDEDLVLYPNYKVWDPDPVSGTMPQWKISRVFFGVDYGVSDNDALIGIAWSDDEGKGYEFFEAKFSRLDLPGHDISQLEYLKMQVMEAWQVALNYFGNFTVLKDNMSPSAIESMIKEAKEANKRILWDADDNDQHVTQELGINCRFKDDPVLSNLTLQIANAHKTDKKIMWDKIDELMRTGRLLIMKGSKLEQECVSTILLRGPNGEIFSEIDDKVYHPDLLPAMRYALWNVMGL